MKCAKTTVHFISLMFDQQGMSGFYFWHLSELKRTVRWISSFKHTVKKNFDKSKA